MIKKRWFLGKLFFGASLFYSYPSCYREQAKHSLIHTYATGPYSIHTAVHCPLFLLLFFYLQQTEKEVKVEDYISIDMEI